MSIKYIAKGIATHEGKSFDVYLDWSDEGGGWYQWRSTRAWAKLFDTEKEAIRAAKECTGPWFNKPERSSIVVEKVDTQPGITSLESHNRELLAVNQVLREALDWAMRNLDERYVFPHAEESFHKHMQSLSIKTGDIALIEIGTVDHGSMIEMVPGAASMVKFRDKVYVIQTKSNTE